MADEVSTTAGVSAAIRIRELEAELEAARAELGGLRLQLDVMSTTDPITGLPNLHGLVELIEDAAARRGRTGESFGILAVRFPELERVFARHGPEAYRETARHLGAVVAAGLRQIDRVGRIDTTTFVAMLPALDPAGVPALTQRLHIMLQRLPLGATEPIPAQPELTFVLTPTEGPTAAAHLLDRLFALRAEAAFGSPVIEVTRATDRRLEIKIP